MWFSIALSLVILALGVWGCIALARQGRVERARREQQPKLAQPTQASCGPKGVGAYVDLGPTGGRRVAAVAVSPQPSQPSLSRDAVLAVLLRQSNARPSGEILRMLRRHGRQVSQKELDQVLDALQSSGVVQCRRSRHGTPLYQIS